MDRLLLRPIAASAAAHRLRGGFALAKRTVAGPSEPGAADLIEMHWARRLAGVPFGEYETHPDAARAARALGRPEPLAPARLFRWSADSEGAPVAQSLRAAVAMGDGPDIVSGGGLAALAASCLSAPVFAVSLLLCGAGSPVLPNPGLARVPPLAAILGLVRRVCPPAQPGLSSPCAAAQHVGAAVCVLGCLVEGGQTVDFMLPGDIAAPVRLGRDLQVLAWNLASGALFAGRACRPALMRALAEGEAQVLMAVRAGAAPELAGAFYTRLDGTPMRCIVGRAADA